MSVQNIDNIIKIEDNSSTFNEDIKIENNVTEIKEFQELTTAVGTQAQLHCLLPSDMYAKITAFENSQKEHEILFQRLSTIIDELSERYNGGNFSPDRISSEGYASKNTNTSESAEDLFEESSVGESESTESIKIENEDNYGDIEEDNINQNNQDMQNSISDEDGRELYRNDDDTTIRKSQRKIRPKLFSDMVYDSFIDNNKQTIRSNNDSSFDITLLSSCSSDQDNISSSTILSDISSNNRNIIQLGPHGTLIDIMDYNSIPWESASAATRKLLGFVFDIETLATHSLTGRPSPAFFGRERPLKNQLDAEKIADIIHAVISKTGASERDIRASITTKCADTTKMYKIKQNRLKMHN